MDIIRDWLINATCKTETLEELINGLANQLNAIGIEVDRLFVGHNFLHPIFLNSLYNWDSCSKQTTVNRIRNQETRAKMFVRSPVQQMAKTQKPVHLKLNGQDTGFDMVNALQEQGFTEYILYPIPRRKRTESDFNFYAFSISTQSPAGFPAPIISWIEGFQSQLSLALEYFRLKTEQDILANSYIGHRAGQRVLKGQIRLGHTEDIDAFVWLCDLRGFTSLSESHSSGVILEYLNSAFEVIVSEIQAIGGEVLKYIGDSVLAIFEQNKAPEQQARQIIQAAEKVCVRLNQLNVERKAAQTPPIDIGIGLHYGTVAYGNIGTSSRLDFTVIGPAINHCSRIEGLCKALQSPILCSSVFAQFHQNLEPVQEVHLKGIAEPQWIFKPRPDA